MRRFSPSTWSIFWLRRLSVAVVSCFLATSAQAEIDIRFQLAPMSEDLQEAIINGSLIAGAARTGMGDTQELFANVNADYARILSILYAQGYFGGVVNIFVNGDEAAEIPPLEVPEEIGEIIVRIYPGPVYLFADVAASPLATGTELPKGFARGAVADIEAIRRAGVASVNAWRAEGHAKAEVIGQEIVARHDENEVDAKLELSPGPKLTFGDISVEGTEAVRIERVKRIAGLEEGLQFDPEEIADAEERLRRAGSFRSVRIVESDDIVGDNELPLVIEVIDQTPRRFGFGAEYATIEGATFSGFWLHRNLLGGGERFRVGGEISGLGGETQGIDYRFGARFERPATPRADTDFFARVELRFDDERDYDANILDFGVGFRRYATDELIVDFGVGLVFSEVKDFQGIRDFDLATLPLGATYDRRRNPLNPKEGFFVDLDVTPFYAIKGTSNGIQAILDARAYQSFGTNDRFTFAARLRTASLAGPDLLNSPPFLLFYSGGAGTVRGQDYQSLGVNITPDGSVRTGGRSFLGTSLELRSGVTEAIEVVAFYDWGYVGAEEVPNLSGRSHSGAGLGLRYNTGIGPIRVDVATPVSGDTPASNLYLYIGIGQAF